MGECRNLLGLREGVLNYNIIFSKQAKLVHLELGHLPMIVIVMTYFFLAISNESELWK
jgi:hypothetical protein